MKTTAIQLLLFIASWQATLAQQNDNCAGAIALTVENACKTSLYTNVGATAEAGTVAQDPSCGLYQGGDVWFTAVMPSSGALRIETENLAGATTHSITLYSGACGSFTEVFCIRQDNKRTFYDPSLVGEELYIRVFSLNGTPGSSFELCVWEPELPVNDNCEGAIALTAGEGCFFDEFTNAYTTSESISIASDPSCGAYMGGDVWFKTTIPSSGYLRIEAENLISATPKSVVIYSGGCSSFTEMFCSELDDKENFYDPNWAGQTVFIRVFSYLTEEGGPFGLCVWEPNLPPNDNCEAAIDILPNEICVIGEYTNALATSQPLSTAREPSCGAYFGGDVWFKTVVPASGILNVETTNLISNTSKSVVVYTGSCGLFTEVFCSELEDKASFFDPNWGGQTAYLRIFSYLTEEGGPFGLCVSDDPCPSIETSVTQTGITLSAVNSNASYQWVDCNQVNDPIPGETGQSFVADGNGSYAVTVTENGCTEISDCYDINVVGISEGNEPVLKVFPNPVSELLQVSLDSDPRQVDLQLIGTNGLIIETSSFKDHSILNLDMSRKSPGLYLLKITTEDGAKITKLIKE